MKRKRQVAAQHGFTLIEVMVALLIVGIALPALLFQIHTQVDATAYLRDKTQAAWIAQNELARLRLEYRLAGHLLRGEAHGESNMAGRHWYWTALSEESAYPGLWRQTVTVGAADEEALVVISGFIHEHADEQ